MNPLDAPLQNHFGIHPAHIKTVREFFAKCLIELWIEEDGFSGKRPFGNSGWASELVISVAVQRGLAKWDEDEQDYDGINYHSHAWKQIEKDITAALGEWLGVPELT